MARQSPHSRPADASFAIAVTATELASEFARKRCPVPYRRELSGMLGGEACRRGESSPARSQAVDMPTDVK